MLETRGNLWLMDRAAEGRRPLANPSARFVWRKSSRATYVFCVQQNVSYPLNIGQDRGLAYLLPKTIGSLL